MNAKTKHFFLQAISIFLGFTFFGAGMAKLFAEHQYFGWIGPVWLIERLEEYELGLYGQFIALSQIFIGYLLITTRFKLLGSIMLVPMILNILMITISQNWSGTPYILGFLLCLDFYILWNYRHFFIPLLNEKLTPNPPINNTARSWIGHLIWCTGLVLQFVAISASYWNIILGMSISLVGIILSILSFKVDRS